MEKMIYFGVLLLATVCVCVLPVSSNAEELANTCEAQGVGDEENFAKQICGVAKNHGLHPTLVHSIGAGGVDIFIPQSEAEVLRKDPKRLEQIVKSLTTLY